MTEHHAHPSEDSVAGVIAQLAELSARLSAARDEQEFLATAMGYLQRFGQQGARLIYVHLDSQGLPHESQVVAQWRRGLVQSDGFEPTVRYPLADDPLTQMCLDQAAEPLLVADIAKEPPRVADAARRCCEGTMGCPLGCEALALLPLRSERYGGWQGLLAFYWEERHTFSPEESAVYRLLMAVLGMSIGGLRSERELGAALTEAALLNEVTKHLNVAMTLEEVLHALLMPVTARDEAEVVLCSIEPEPNGTPGWLTVISMWTAAGQPVSSQIGARYYLPDIPFSKLYMSSPDAPLLISDIEHDPRVDDYARSLYAATGAKATIVMALMLQGRWVGLFNITWKRPVPLGEREQRIYQTLAKQAALLLDNSLMLERLRASLRETQQQGALLKTILDHIPVGVALLEAPWAQPVLGNAYLDRMLGGGIDKQVSDSAVLPAYRFVQPGTESTLPTEELPAQRALRTGKMETIELDILHANNERIHAEAHAVPIWDERGAVRQVIVLLNDLSTRKRAERERAQLQEEVIRFQAAALAERSSPLIPITDEILVLPLIGSIDTERGQQVLDTVLQGSSQRGARVAIIDITGVRTVDTQAASALTSAAQALRLLGVEPVLTGIRPEVAQTLVSLGVELAGIVTRSTLQSGIQYALRHLGKAPIK